MTKDNFDKWKSIGVFKKTDCEVVEETVDQLIENLYKPCDDERAKDGIDFVADGEKLKLHGITDEPINWGDLKVCDVEKRADYFLVIVDEASPSGCQGLVNYIEHYMTLWGWNVRVQTEW